MCICMYVCTYICFPAPLFPPSLSSIFRILHGASVDVADPTWLPLPPSQHPSTPSLPLQWISVSYSSARHNLQILAFFITLSLPAAPFHIKTIFSSLHPYRNPRPPPSSSPPPLLSNLSLHLSSPFAPTLLHLNIQEIVVVALVVVLASLSVLPFQF